jgi:membrane protein
VIVSLTGYFFGRDAGNTQVGDQIAATFGKDTANQIQKMIEQASETKNSVWATIVGTINILIGATGVFAQF